MNKTISYNTTEFVESIAGESPDIPESTLPAKPTSELITSPVERESIVSMEDVRKRLVDTYEATLQELTRLSAERGKVEREKPLITVVVSIWEEDDNLTASKMFENSLDALLHQAETGNLDLDIIVVGNNGGGKTTELGQRMIERLNQHFAEKYPEIPIQKLETHRPQGDYYSGTPWEVSIPLEPKRAPGQNRLYFIEQPKDLAKDGKDKLTNAGKIRALRDVSHALVRNYKQGYVPDAIFQMDAETILQYQEGTVPAGTERALPPLKALYNKLSRKGYTAVGTKDIFEVIDPVTGKPKDKPKDTAQAGFMLTNTKTIAIPGGALLSKPENYIAGMVAISEVTPGAGVEDYLYTQLLRDEAKRKGYDFDNNVATTAGIIGHTNRATEDTFSISKQAERVVGGSLGPSVRQLDRWYTQSRAVNQIFPELNAYQSEKFLGYVKLIVLKRLEDTIRERDPRHLIQLLIDAARIPEAIKMLKNEEVADILNGAASWGHSFKK